MLRFYHDIFITNINQLGSIIDYTYEELVSEVKKAYLYGFNFAALALGTLLGPKEDVMDVERLQGLMSKQALDPGDKEVEAELEEMRIQMENSFRKNIEFQKRMKDLMDEVIELGIM